MEMKIAVRLGRMKFIMWQCLAGISREDFGSISEAECTDTEPVHYRTKTRGHLNEVFMSPPVM
jgi:hypothetical protein